jgi:holo-[acyl-carrier protein] synthase
VGIDLVDVARVEQLLERHPDRSVTRLLTDDERAYCFSQAAPAPHVAARLAAKEAAFKALAGGGDTAFLAWREFEVTRKADGTPGLTLHGGALETAKRLEVGAALVSLTHTQRQAAAVVVFLKGATAGGR